MFPYPPVKQRLLQALKVCKFNADKGNRRKPLTTLGETKLGGVEDDERGRRHGCVGGFDASYH